MPISELNNQEYDFNELAKKYNEFRGRSFQILIDGNDILKDGIVVSRVVVNTTIDSTADVFYFDIVNAYNLVNGELDWLDKYFTPGKYIEIKMGYAEQIESVFYGVITSIEVYIRSEESIVTIKGMDCSFLMMRGVYSNTWNEMKYSDVVQAISGKYGMGVEIDSTSEKMMTITQDNESDFLFLKRLASLNNFDFFIVGKKIYFRKALKDKKSVVTLTIGKNLHRFNIDIDILSQVSQVVVRGWDGLENKVIEGKSSTIEKLGKNPKTGLDIMKSLGKNYVEYVHTNVDSVEEANVLAAAIHNRYAMELIKGEGETVGIPELRAGRYIELAGVGKKLSQLYYLTSVTHTIDDSGYLTTFTVGGNAI